ncbi:hypothetical protein WS62_06265 [Burkholderia sp. ABCPW 14]|nr:hypothetical protein WS62_06265 [Burkholderia sp. ABCPW 14]
MPCAPPGRRVLPRRLRMCPQAHGVETRDADTGSRCAGAAHGDARNSGDVIADTRIELPLRRHRFASGAPQRRSPEFIVNRYIG